MKKLIKFPKIVQFVNVIQNILRQVNFVGLDENGDAIYDPTIPKPTIKFVGTVKGHGTNAGVSFNAPNGIWYQSRENLITPQVDNAGFAFFASSNEQHFMRIIHDVAVEHDINLHKNTITIYGEWMGSGIQKNVAVSELPKAFYLFGIKISPFDEESVAYWVDIDGYENQENKIYNINTFGTYEVEVDLNNPKLSQNKIIDITEAIEAECPIGKYFGISGVGEGIVFICDFKGSRHIFKSKGLLHAGKSKVKVTKRVDDEKINLINDIVDKVTPIWRLDQMLTKSCDLLNGGTIERAKLGDYIRLVINDVLEEDSQVITDAGLEPKDINKGISEVARKYFFEQEQNQLS